MALEIGQRVTIVSVSNTQNNPWVGKQTHITDVWYGEGMNQPLYTLAITRTVYFIEEQLVLIVPESSKAGDWATLLDVWVPAELADKIKRPQG